MSEKPEPSVRLFSYSEDQPNEQRGSLIPRSIAIDELIVEKGEKGEIILGLRRVVKATLVPVLSVAMLALVVFSGYNLATSSTNVASVPNITVYDPYTTSRTTLENGPQDVFSGAAFFAETREAMIEAGQSFIEIDIPQETVRFFRSGVLVFGDEMVSSPTEGSWWDVPSGLYEVAEQKDDYFSQYTQTYFPWSIVFEGNYLIHGTPVYPNGVSVADTFTGGGVRLSDEAAKKLYALVDVETQIIVRAPQKSTNEFVYEPVGPDISTELYLVADIETGTNLVSSNLDTAVPVASLTKLMTAVVAAEKMSLEDRVYAASPTFVESLVPRLAERSSVSMYSLLQLLLVESSNEAAEVIAGTYGREAFITEMNNKARQVGMFDTEFSDPSGLRSDNVSTLSDLFILTQYISEQRNFIFEITNTGEAIGVEGGGEFTNLSNFNEVENLENFIGGKIGETSAAGMTSVSLHTIQIDNEERVVAVILLASKARNDDIKALLNFVAERYN